LRTKPPVMLPLQVAQAVTGPTLRINFRHVESRENKST
jgi:hypothetical protein